MGCSTVVLGYSSTAVYTQIPPIKNQIGIMLWSGTTGIEIAGAGVSYGTTSYTLISGVSTNLSFMNANGSSLILATNGNGIPVFNTILEPLVISGAPNLWMSAGTTNLTLRFAYLQNDPLGT
jgi:hypothetical protein